MEPVKIVLIGAGSSSFGPGTINSLLAARDLLAHRSLHLVLVDTNEAALDRMSRYAAAIRAYRGLEVALEATTDRCEALPGADFVVTAVSVRRYELWREDFLVPLAYGFRHPYGECGGPGAAFHTLRSLHLIIPIARDMERLCPDAWLLNFTNPESRVCQGVSQLTQVRSAGLCHGFHSTYQTVAEVLGRPAEGLELDLGGLNHFHWVLGIRDRATGQDLLPEFERAMSQGGSGNLPPLTRFLYETFGRLPFPSDDHIGEYLRFGYEFLGPHYLQYEARVEAGAAWENAPAQVVSSIADGTRAVTEELAAPSGELVAPLITDIMLNTGARRESVNVPNVGPAIANLPTDAVVEVPATADADGIHPAPVGPLPEPVAALCQTQVAIQKLLVEAYATGSRQALLQALLLEPTVDDTRRCRQMMDEMLRRQQPYLPELT
ncbi:MAG: alpha-glucosidase/alpha-galactosidase [Armatimonadetes bacterium]|nr:alpha-glucosidase/alpha-galactosidase [Armatimonadota bacterium]